MKRAQWRSVFDTYQQACTLLEEYLPKETATGPGDQKPPAGDPQELLRELHKLLREGIKSLEQALLRDDQHLGALELEDVLRPFVYLVDELVQRRLAETKRSEEWPMLQFERFQEDSGGDLFFELADERLKDSPGSSTLIYEMLHFCLTAGFKGRYEDRPARLRDYKMQLAERIPQPELASAPPVPVTTGETRLPEVPYLYYGVTGFFVLALPVVLWWSSR
ncbi:DotU family type IV/VI secretion system protein [Archangium lansingense]|uniref:DotU family type IV/VI secretion system protein n=1 Tax=Archangium lansingense TaxID=2995310 RepID=UPI003B799D84